SFIASLAATVSYFFSTTKNDISVKQQWRKLARIFFIMETVSVISIFAILFYIISNHLFEYKYAWQHSSKALEMKYLLACFWEGQEGSFLLWTFWHCILGLVVMKKEREWEAPVMTVVSFVQFCLATMIIGFTFWGAQVGSNPFTLLRNELEAPIFSRPDYLSLVTDGNDLNPLLQNYWMVIHPPVLFLGFASCLIPFAFAFAGLWTKDYNGWTKPALPWALFAAGVFGLGVMMGAAWAYESLNFGGFWAWDPVENASLVPWLVLVAGIHTLIIYRSTGNALRSTFLFFILSFLLVLYSTYLTRSGVLQETSVHAFTGDGIAPSQLLFFLGVLGLPALALFLFRYKHIPHIVKEEEASSREFWMFIGSLVLFLSALSIIVMTSLPVFNKIAGLFAGEDTELFKPLAFSEDTAHTYNRIQIYVAIILALLTAITQYLKYKATSRSYVMGKLLWPTLAAAVVSSAVFIWGDINYLEYGIGYLVAIWMAIACSVYAVIANLSYLWVGLKGKLNIAGASVGHLGFGLMLLGILVSSAKKEVISYNMSGIFAPLGKDSKEKPGENSTLIKGVRTDMGKFWVTYEKDASHPKKSLWFYDIKFEDKASKEAFTLRPNAFVNYKGNEALMANPDAKHYWNYDVFTYITSLADPTKKEVDTTTFVNETVKAGDTVFYSKGFAVVQKITSRKNIPNAGFAPEDSATIATVKVFAKSESIYTSELLLVNKGGALMSYPDTIMAESLVLQLQKVNGEEAEVGVKESDSIMKYVTLKAYKFPFINLLWIGTILMVTGFIMAMMRRIRMNRSNLARL
ncbi:MAG: cytochrome c biogenesis protein CcsA, partial [Chitinophagaceae bacterium]